MRVAEKLWRLKYSILLLVVLQAFDTLSTILALGFGFDEGNPLVARLLDGSGAALVLVKWAVVGLVFLGVALDPLEKPYVPAAIVTMNIVYAVVLSNNFAAYGYASGDWYLPVAFWALMLALATVSVDEAFFRPGRQERTGPSDA